MYIIAYLYILYNIVSVETVANLACRTVLPNGLPPPDKISVPDLSPSLKLALQSGEKSAQIFNQTLKECEIFYTTKYPTIADSAYYQAIGKKMITKYPSLAYADGTNPWVNFLILITDYVKHSQMLLTKFKVIDLLIFLLNFIFLSIEFLCIQTWTKNSDAKVERKPEIQETSER